MVGDQVTAKIKSKEIKWISSSIWPEENSVDGTVSQKIKLNDQSQHFSQIKSKKRTQPIQNPGWFPFEVIALMGQMWTRSDSQYEIIKLKLVYGFVLETLKNILKLF